MQKLYCYVDENGMETEGRLFIVAVVVIDGDPQEIISQCEELERLSLKGKSKWRTSRHERRMDYLRRAFVAPALRGRICYEVFKDTQDYEKATIEAIARAVRQFAGNEYTTFIYVDALSKSKRHIYGARLRKTGVATHKVQGVAKDESNALIRLADAIAGFVRDAMDGDSAEIVALFQAAGSTGTLVEV